MNLLKFLNVGKGVVTRVPSTATPPGSISVPVGLSRAEEREAASRAYNQLTISGQLPTEPTPAPAPKPVEPKPVDAWLAKFKTPTYWHQDGNYPINRELIKSTCEYSRFDFLILQEQIASKMAEGKALHDQLPAVVPGAGRKMLGAMINSNHVKVSRGEPPDELPNVDILEAQFEAKRTHIRDSLKALAVRSKADVEALLKHWEAAARSTAELLDQEERERAAKFPGTKFYPSWQLCAVVFLAVDFLPRHRNLSLSDPLWILQGLANPEDFQTT